MAVQTDVQPLMMVLNQLRNVYPNLNSNEMLKTLESGILKCSIEAILDSDLPPILTNYERKKIELRYNREKKQTQDKMRNCLEKDTRVRRVQYLQNILKIKFLSEKSAAGIDINHPNSSPATQTMLLGGSSFQKIENNDQKLKKIEELDRSDLLKSHPKEFENDQSQAAISESIIKNFLGLDSETIHFPLSQFDKSKQIKNVMEEQGEIKTISLDDIFKKYENYQPQKLQKKGKSKLRMSDFIGIVDSDEKIDSVKDHNL